MPPRTSSTAKAAQQRAEAKPSKPSVASKGSGRARRHAGTNRIFPIRSRRAQPEAKAQRNFTDPDSRIMPEWSEQSSFVQGYNVQAAVDATAQVIVAGEVTEETKAVCERENLKQA